jgi:hypothetical protein
MFEHVFFPLIDSLANHYRPGSIPATKIHKGNMAFKQRVSELPCLIHNRSGEHQLLFRTGQGNGCWRSLYFCHNRLVRRKEPDEGISVVLPTKVQVLDCLMEIQKIYDQDQYKAAIKEAKEQGPVLVSEAVTTDTSASPPSLQTPSTLTGPDSMTTITQDEELRKQLKYIPKLAEACQNWVEGILIRYTNNLQSYSKGEKARGCTF